MVTVPFDLPGLEALHAATSGDPEIRIAVLDGPVDLDHPCFAGADLETVGTLLPVTAGSGPMTVHGTHVASLLFGQPGSPVTGVAPRCRGLIAPVFRDQGRGRVLQLDLARAIEQVVERGANVINFSGGERTPTGQPEGSLERALRLCDERNVLVVAAVGNDGCDCLHVPAAVSSVLAVGASGEGGRPVDSSNWGEGYAENGVLAPGEDVPGARVGGGLTRLTGSSQATPAVSGLAGLLLSRQRQLGLPPDPAGVRAAILRAARPCDPSQSPASTDCRRYLAGSIDVAAAHAAITEGVPAVPNQEDAQTGLLAATHTDPDPAADVGPPEPVPAAPTPALVAAGAPAPSPPVRHAAAVGARAASAECQCEEESPSYVFAIGQVGFDFGTEARRDTFRQLMPRVLVDGPGDANTSLPANPYDVVQLCDYLDSMPSESTKVIFLLCLDLVPLYALEAELAYAEEVYSVLRGALRNQVLPVTDENYVARVSIPGTMTTRTRRLFSGQVVPVVVVQPRGLSTWNEPALIEFVVQGVAPDRQDVAPDDLRQMIRVFLDKVYYELRNLGQTSPDRALNFAATNAIQVANLISEGFLSGTRIPAPTGRQGPNLYALDTITVSKSPYCRPGSDCWDVQLKFFDPEDDRRAKGVYLLTIDVSDEMPVSLAPVHHFYTS